MTLNIENKETENYLKQDIMIIDKFLYLSFVSS